MPRVIQSEADSSLTYIYGINTLLSMVLGSMGSGAGGPSPKVDIISSGDAAHTNK